MLLAQKKIRAAMMAASLTLMAWGAMPAAHAGAVNNGSVNALMVTETLSTNSVQTNATTGPLSDQTGYVGQSVTGAGANSSALGFVPQNNTLTSTTYANNAAAEQAVTSYLQQNNGGAGSYLSQIGTAMTAAMKSASSSANGAQIGYFTLITNVQVANPAGGANAAQIASTVQVDANGQYQFLGSNVNTNTIYLIYAIYQQDTAAYYLPANYTVQGAGDLQWELYAITLQGNTMTGSPEPVGGSVWHTVNLNGAYDGTETTVNGKEQISYTTPIANLMTQQIDPLMSKYNASLAEVVYGMQVTAARNAQGQPLLAVDVQSRTFTGQTSGCGATNPSTLTSSGLYGYLLNENSNEYLVQSNGSYNLMQQISQNTISPNQSFSNTNSSIPAGSSYSSYENDLVFPISPDANQIVNYTSGNPIPEADYTYMAPLQVHQQSGGHWALPISVSFSGDVSSGLLTMNFNGVQFASRTGAFEYPGFGPASSYAYGRWYTPAWTTADIPVVVNGNSAYIPVSVGSFSSGSSSGLLTMNFNGVQFASTIGAFGYPGFGPASSYAYGRWYTPAWTTANIPLVCQP